MQAVGQGLLKYLSKNYVAELLDILSAGPRRFSDLVFDLHLNPGILARLLNEGCAIGVMQKDMSGAYLLTDTGKKARVLVNRIRELR